MTLSTDAIIFGLGFLRGPKAKLSFGGDGAEMEITYRGEAALNDLIDAGYATEAPPSDQIKNRRHYVGTDKEPHLGEIAKAAKIDPFSPEYKWVVFERIVK